MTQKNYLLYSGVVFAFVFLLHASRIMGEWSFLIAGKTIPMSVSWAAVVVTGLLAFQAFKIGGFLKGKK